MCNFSDSTNKESACEGRGHEKCGFNLWVGWSPGVGNCNLLQYCCLENSMDRGAWRARPWCCKESDTTDRLSTH